MKFLLAITLCQLFFFYTFCQADKSENRLTEIRKNIITLQVPDSKPSVTTHITSLIVIDSRFDTTSLGFYKDLSNKNYSIATATNSATEIAGFLKNYLQVKTKDSSDGASVVMVIKKLLLTNELEEDNGESSNKRATAPWLSGVMLKVEFYSGFKYTYIPFYTFDTTYTVPTKIGYHAKDYLSDVLIMSVQKLIRIHYKNVFAAEKKMSLEEIGSYSKQQFNIPVVTAKAYKKGVYKTFDEFKMNNPSLENYELKKEKFSEMIFGKDEKGEYPLRDLWGFCDGIHLYIKSAENYFELVKRQNTFIINGAKALSRSRGVKVGNLLVLGLFAGGVGKGNKKISYDLNLKIYELDMDSGQIY